MRSLARMREKLTLWSLAVCGVMLAIGLVWRGVEWVVGL